jgi:hypothetical protein
VLANQAKSLAIAYGARLPFGLPNEPMRWDITATTGGPLILRRRLKVAPASCRMTMVFISIRTRGTKAIKPAQNYDHGTRDFDVTLGMRSQGCSPVRVKSAGLTIRRPLILGCVTFLTSPDTGN